MLKIPPNYRIPVGISIALHIILLVILAIKLPSTAYRTNAPIDAKIVHAVVVNPKAVQNEINRIHQEQQQKELVEQQKQAAAKAHLQALQQQALALQKQRQAEQARLAQLQADKLRLQKEAEHAAAVKKQNEILAKQQAATLAKQKALAAQQQARKLQQQKAAQQQKLLAEQQKLQQQLMQNQLASEQKELSQARATQMQGVLDQYKAQIIQAIQQQWLVPDNANKELSCVLLIHLAPDGVVLSVVVAQTSGDAVLDRSAKDAVFKASPLPVPKDSALFENFRELRLTVRPLQVMGG